VVHEFFIKKLDFRTCPTNFWPNYGDFLQLLPPFQNIKCFSFVKQMYLDTFYIHTKRCLDTFVSQI
jgi:hypothetical protein